MCHGLESGQASSRVVSPHPDSARSAHLPKQYPGDQNPGYLTVYSNTHVHHTQKKESHRFTNTTQIKYTHTQVHNHIWTHYTNHLHKLYMNTDTTYRTRCQQVQGAVNRFTGENYVSTEAVIWFTGKNQIKVGFKLICRILRKLTIKNLPTKIAVMTLKS